MIRYQISHLQQSINTAEAKNYVSWKNKMISLVISQRITSDHGKDKNWIGKLSKIEIGRFGIDKMKAKSLVYLKKVVQMKLLSAITFTMIRSSHWKCPVKKRFS